MAMTCTGCGIDIKQRQSGVKCKDNTPHNWQRDGAPIVKTNVTRRERVAVDGDTESHETNEQVRARRRREAISANGLARPERRDWPEDDAYSRNTYNSCAWGVHDSSCSINCQRFRGNIVTTIARVGDSTDSSVAVSTKRSKVRRKRK